MSQNGKLMPNLDQQSTKALNLTVLQRVDPFVEEILAAATHVTLYEFNIDQNQWRRKDVEGSLFVVKRNTQPRFQFIVMNRRNTDNLVEDLLGDFEFELQVPYLLYRNAAQEVNGIWFYNSQDCEAVAALFSRILHAFSKVPSNPRVSSKSVAVGTLGPHEDDPRSIHAHGGVGEGLLGAKIEFEELEAAPTSNLIEGPLEPPASSTPAVSNVPDDSFVTFFGATMNINNASGSTIPGPPQLSRPPISLFSHTPNAVPSPTPILQPSPLPAPSIPLVPNPNNLDLSGSDSNNQSNLVKPSFFTPSPSLSPLIMPPVSSSIPSAPPVQPPVTMQHPHGTPLLQPYPPPTPPPSLTPAPTYGPVFTRDSVRDALLKLVQNDNFIDMVYREMLNSHSS
ncbi:mRNA-decapping enzyme-like protein [Acorus calamus]|uniref:mRNA-decapping enzyme-like protein n=1 Tax=Acorus calamus TaxID=4465 RepID=A0AAV9FG81_ACOCL|nr:mRNA-decapping enzyme-like protein [Acorus calamus]